MKPFLHYLLYGYFEGRDPGPTFDSGHYLNAAQDAKQAGIDTFIKYTQEERRIASVHWRDLSLISSSNLFDKNWYLANNPDIAQSRMDPVFHYLCYGGFEGRDPGPNFHSAWYLDAYEDIKKAGINPLAHYLKYGWEEGRELKLFALAKMYDYSKQANCIVYEDSPERIHVQPPSVIGSFSGSLEEGEALCPPAYVSIIEDAVVIGGADFVIVKKDNILSDELMDFPGKDFGFKSPLVKYRRGNTLLLGHIKESGFYIKEGIHLSCGHDANYFHWLIECLPKLILIDELKQFKDVPILIQKGLHKNLEAALARVNINNRPFIYLEPNVPYHVERLVYPSALSRIVDRYEGSPVFDVDIILSHKWVSKVSELLKRDLQSDQKPWRKLFLTRRKGLRALGNLEQLELMLLEHGFEIVELDGASLDSQVELFSRASLVVAPTGAALTNMLFCPPGTKVIIFMSNHETTNYYFWSNLGAIMKLDVTIIAGERLFNLTNYWSVHDDYVIDANILLDEVKKISGAKNEIDTKY